MLARDLEAGHRKGQIQIEETKEQRCVEARPNNSRACVITGTVDESHIASLIETDATCCRLASSITKCTFDSKPLVQVAKSGSRNMVELTEDDLNATSLSQC